MFCRACNQPLVNDGEKALDGEIQEVWRSTLTQEWTCERNNGDEHDAGTIADWGRNVLKSMEEIQTLIETGVLTEKQAYRVLRIDAGLVERSATSKRIGEVLKSGKASDMMDLLEELDQEED